MPVDKTERYKLVFGQYHHAEDLRVKIIQGCGLIYVGLAAAFAWVQKGPQSLSWMVTLAGIVATAAMWAADYRNRSGLGDWRQVGAEVEKDPAAAIPAEQRFFDRPEPSRVLLSHGFLINVSASLIIAFLVFATVYLWCSKGVLPR